jgi:hypothetical protein
MNNYDHLFNFLGSCFPDMDFEGLTDADVVKEYKKTVSQAELYSVITEAKEVSKKIENYWKIISKEANLYFKDQQEALAWLNSIIKLLENG